MQNIAPGQVQQGMPDRTTDTQDLSGEAEGVRFRILYRDVNSIVECQLQPNARINIAAGSMAAMSANLKLEGKVKLKKMFSGGKTCSSCVTAPNGAGELILAPPMMADVMALHLNGGTEWIVGESCFLGSTPGVQKTTKTQGKLPIAVAWSACSLVAILPPASVDLSVQCKCMHVLHVVHLCSC